MLRDDPELIIKKLAKKNFDAREIIAKLLELDAQRRSFQTDSDAIITKGIISLLIRVYNGQKAEDILAADEGFLETIGLRENLSPTRANGLVSMIRTIKGYASAYCEGQ